MTNIFQKSRPAICGIGEMQVIVETKNIKKSLNKIKKRGFKIVGTSYGNDKYKTIWYI